MEVKRIYTEDLQIAKAIIERDNNVTRQYFYQQSYPLFKSIYDNYYTGCSECKEFIDEIYLLVISPSKITGKCQLENFLGESTLTSWLKSVCLFFCYRKFELKKRIPIIEPLPKSTEKEDDDSDSLLEKCGSNELDFSNMNRSDVETIINLMPNKRYGGIIRLRYLEHKTNEETAAELGMTMDNYYNKHKLAKEQFIKILRKEGQND